MSNQRVDEIIRFKFADEITKPAGDATGIIGRLSNRIEDMGKNLQFWDGVIAGTLAKTLEKWTSAAGEAAANYENSWKSLNYSFKDVGVSHDELADSISEVTKQTTLSAGVCRDFYQSMITDGVTNVDLLEDSIISLYGNVGLTGRDFDKARDAMIKMVNAGRLMPRMLENTGLNLSDMSRELGVTQDELKNAFKNSSPEERLQILDAAMGDTTEGVKMFNESLQGTQNEVNRAVGGIAVVLGQALLPGMKTLNFFLSSIIGMLKDLLSFPGFNILASGALTLVTAIIALVAYLKMLTYYQSLYASIQELNMGLGHKQVKAVLELAKAYEKEAVAILKANWELIAICMTILVLIYALDKLFNLGWFEGVSKALHGGLSPAEDLYSGGAKSAIEGTNPAYAVEPLPEYSGGSYANNTTNIYVQQGAFDIDARNKTQKECKQDIITGLQGFNEAEKIDFKRTLNDDRSSTNQPNAVR